MKVLAIVSQKGGSGKTTLALNLALEARRRGIEAVVLDADPQASACAWSDWRQVEPLPVIPVPAARLAHTIKEAEEGGVGLVVIDTPPAADGAAVAAARAADLVLSPVRPHAFDLHAVRATADLMRVAQRSAYAVLNCVPARAARLSSEAAALIAESGLDLAPVRLSERAALRHATIAGLGAQEFEPEGKAAVEIARLFDFVRAEIELEPATAIACPGAPILPTTRKVGGRMASRFLATSEVSQ